LASGMHPHVASAARAGTSLEKCLYSGAWREVKIAWSSSEDSLVLHGRERETHLLDDGEEVLEGVEVGDRSGAGAERADGRLAQVSVMRGERGHALGDLRRGLGCAEAPQDDQDLGGAMGVQVRCSGALVVRLEHNADVHQGSSGLHADGVEGVEGDEEGGLGGELGFQGKVGVRGHDVPDLGVCPELLCCLLDDELEVGADTCLLSRDVHRATKVR